MEQELYDNELMDTPLEDTDELYHFGIKGMKWGIRRFQTKNGALTKAGQKRYNKEMEKLKAKKKKLKNEERTTKKMAKLNKMKSDVEELETQKKAKKKSDHPEETIEQKRERLLKSTDAKEIYENRNLLTTQELNERINRIDTETKLQGKIVKEKQQSGVDWVNDKMQKTNTTITNATNLYKSVDNAYNTFANSTAGKILENNLGVKLPKGEKPKKQFNKEDFNETWKNFKNLSDSEAKDFMNAVNNYNNTKDKMDTFNGVKKNNNNKGGMSRDDIEDLIKQMVKEDSLEQSGMNDSIHSYDSLMHFGIKGMKWGVHRFYNADGTRTAAGKKRENEAKRDSRANGEMTNPKPKMKKTLSEAADDYTPSLDEYGYAKDLEIKKNVRNHKDVTIWVDGQDTNDWRTPASKEVMKNRAKSADEFLKNYDDNNCMDRAYKDYEFMVESWNKGNSEKLSKIPKEDFTKNLELTDIRVIPDDETYISSYYDKNKTPWGGHTYSIEGHTKSKRILQVSMDG